MSNNNTRNYAKYRLFLFAAVMVILCITAALWRILPFENWISYEKLQGAALFVQEHPLAPLMVIVSYVIGGLIVFPVLILIPTTALLFGPVWGPLYSFLGILANASVLYAIGHLIGHKTLRQLAGNPAHLVSQRLSRHGLLTIITLRLLPLAPFTVINLTAGASHIKFKEYTAGTLIGMSPAIVIMSLLGTQLGRTLSNPISQNITIFIAGAVLLLFVSVWLKRRFT